MKPRRNKAKLLCMREARGGSASRVETEDAEIFTGGEQQHWG